MYFTLFWTFLTFVALEMPPQHIAGEVGVTGAAWGQVGQLGVRLGLLVLRLNK